MLPDISTLAPRFMRAFLALLLFVAGSATAQDAPDWLSQGPPGWFVWNEDVETPGYVSTLADHGCPDYWPDEINREEAGISGDDYDVHIRVIEACLYELAVRHQRVIAEVYDERFTELASEFSEGDDVDPEARLRFREWVNASLDALVNEHQAWLNWSEAECEYQGSLYYGGTGANTAWAVCAEATSRERAARLVLERSFPEPNTAVR